MTINEYAKKQGVSRQAVYQKYTKAGMTTRELTDRNGNLTTNGLKKLDSLYSAAPDHKNLEEKPTPAADDQIDDLKEQLIKAQAERDALKDQIEEYKSLFRGSQEEKKTLTDLLAESQRQTAEALRQNEETKHQYFELLTTVAKKLNAGKDQDQIDDQPIIIDDKQTDEDRPSETQETEPEKHGKIYRFFHHKK